MVNPNTRNIGRKTKKVWYPLIAPKLFSNQIIGKTLVYSPEDLMHKPVSINLMNLTGDVKNQNINIGFRVLGVKNGQGLTDLWSYTIIPSHVKRIVRKKLDKIDDSFILQTKDNVKLRVKPLILTLNKTSRKIRKILRKTAKESLAKTFNSFIYEDLIRNILMRKLQNGLSRELRKTTPIKACEIRVLERLSEKDDEKAKVMQIPKETKTKPLREKAAPKKASLKASAKQTVEVAKETKE